MKRVLAILLCLAMGFAVVACAETGKTTGSDPAGTTSPDQSTAPKPPTKVVYVYPTMAGPQQDLGMVQDAINAISVPAINVEVKLSPVAMGAYIEQAGLMITGNEDVDLFLTLPAGSIAFTTMVGNNQVLPLDDVFAEFGKGIQDAYNDVNADFLNGCRINETLYGIPPLYDKASNTYFYFTKDVLTRNNLDLYSARNINDIEAIVKTIYEKENQAVLACGSPNSGILLHQAAMINFEDFSTPIFSEFFGSGVWGLGAIIGDNNSTVINPFETDYFEKYVRLTRDWYNKGYVYKDAASAVADGTDLIKNGVVFGAVSAGETGYEAIASQRGVPVSAIPIATVTVTTGAMQKFVWVMPITCDTPEAAMRFLDFTYTNKEFVDYINFGIEGTHYVYNDKGAMDLPAGLTMDSNPYVMNATYFFGSQFLANVWSNENINLRKDVKAANQELVSSPYMGLTIDTHDITNEIAAVNNTITQYWMGRGMQH
ncbi:MAG: extracellular solute-binding protein [Saccharofermentanales bacterium]|jgi:putative aldouronate transport system substrate-binding protein